MAAVDVAKYIIDQLEMTDSVEITASADEIVIAVKKDEIGRVIGKQGKTAKAIRSVVRAAATREGKRYNVDIKELG